MKKVMVAEDESAIREFIVINLKRSGYDVTEAEDGAQALQLYDASGGDFDVVLLDIMMPEMDGITVCKELRKRSESVGIIMLTAKTEEMDKVTGLLVGADDYVTKPFSPAELMARVDSVYRRVAMVEKTGAASRDQIALGEFVLDLRSRTLTKGGRNIELTQVEFQIMEYFFQNPGAALARSQILQHVWGSSTGSAYYTEDKIVDVNIRRLRKKVEDDPSSPKHLMTIWGIGYKWVT
ncbi:MAG: response regulator transcription factor [Acutalibacteraceae bacterium]|nr:response regulator transcription factor [Acutalibacteraceae bacterium]